MATLRKADYVKMVEEKEAGILVLTKLTKTTIKFADWSKFTIPMLKDYIGYLTTHHIRLEKLAIPIKAGLDNKSKKNYIKDSTTTPIKATGNIAQTEQAKRNTMSQINVSYVESILNQEGFVKDQSGIFTGPDSFGAAVIKFTAKTIRVVYDGVTQVIHQNKASNASFAAILLGIKNEQVMPEHVNQEFEPVEAPVEAPTREQSPNGPEIPTAPIKPTPAKPTKPTKPAKKVEKVIVGPTNPTPGSTPVFDKLQKAVTDVETYEDKTQSIWADLGKEYGYSVKPLVAALYAEGKWLDAVVTDKDGAVLGPKTVYNEEDGKYHKVPMGYQAMMKLEKLAGAKGAGYFVNKAMRSFSRVNPDNVKTPEELDKIKKDKETKKQEGMTVDKILVQLTKYAELLNEKSAKDLDSWVEATLCIQESIERINTNKGIMDAIPAAPAAPAAPVDPLASLAG